MKQEVPDKTLTPSALFAKMIDVEYTLFGINVWHMIGLILYLISIALHI